MKSEVIPDPNMCEEKRKLPQSRHFEKPTLTIVQQFATASIFFWPSCEGLLLNTKSIYTPYVPLGLRPWGQPGGALR